MDLKPKAREALAQLMERSGEDKTAVVCKALVILNLLEDSVSIGGRVHLLMPDGTTHRLVGL